MMQRHTLTFTCLGLACISPAREDYGESLNTLKYAQRAKEIENVPIVNDLNEMSEMALMQEDVEVDANIFRV